MSNLLQIVSFQTLHVPRLIGTHLDVMATILHDGIGRAIGTAQQTQLVKHLHPFVGQVDRRL